MSSNYNDRFVQSPPYSHYENAYPNHLAPQHLNQLDTTNTYVEMPTESLDDGRERDERARRAKHKKQRRQDRRSKSKPEEEKQPKRKDLEKNEDEVKAQKRLFSFLFGKKIAPVPLEEDRKPYPWKNANYLSRMVFFWLWPMLVKGYKKTLVPDDLWALTPNLTVQVMHAKYLGHLDKILKNQRAKHSKKHPNDEFEWPAWAVPYALFKTFQWQYLRSCLFLALSFVCMACAPLITKELINYVNYRYFGVYTTYDRGVAYTIAAVVLIFINGILLNHYFHNAMVTGAAVKLILTKEILLKSFKLLARSKHKFLVGRITSLMSTDLLRIDLAVGFQPLVVCFPIPVVISVVLLLHNIGVTSLAGIGLFIISLVVCVLLTSKLFITREHVVKYTDERISLMREVLNNLKVIKFYAWELAYKASITKVRGREMRYLFTIKVLRNFITAYAVTLPTLTSMVSFVTMWSTNDMKGVSNVFSSLSLYSILAQAIMLLPIALATGADAFIGFRRCKDFLSSGEYDDELEQRLKLGENYIGPDDDASSEAGFEFGGKSAYEFDRSSDLSSFNEKTSSLQVPAIVASHADFIWEQFNDTAGSELNSLWDEVPEQASPDLYATSAALTRQPTRLAPELQNASFPGLLDVNLTVNQGEFVVVTGAIGLGKSSLLNALAGFMKRSAGLLDVNGLMLLCLSPWIQNTTVRRNILFGRVMDYPRYYAVLAACCLDDDMKDLPFGDSTEIGERGITLSGGQKARITLARAVYAGSATLLFDDVLLAVDSRVGRHITTNLFLGLLKNHTRVLATHQLSLVQLADKVVYLNGDGLIDVGTPHELVENNGGFRRLVEFAHDNVDASNEKESVITTNFPVLSMEPPAREASQNGVGLAAKEMIGKTMQDEDVAVNAVSWDVYKKYINLGSGVFGIWAAPLFLLLVALATFCQLFTNTWLSFWMERRFKTMPDTTYVAVYVMLAVMTVIVTGVQFTMLAYMNNRSAELLNVRAVAKVLHAPMAFMDTNPLGRVLNRFTKDTDSLDNEIGEQLRLFIFPLATIIGIVILCICYLPWFAITVPFFAVFYYFFSDIYSSSSREIKRLEAVQRSVVYNNFNEVLTGMATIKAYHAEQLFVDKNDYLLNRQNEAYFLSIATQRWLCVHLDTMASLFALVICMLCITDQFEISASSTGLLLNYVIQIVGLLSLTVRAMTQVETEMNSVERLHSYAFNMPQEADYEKPEAKPAPEWPMAGYIQFNDVSLRYRPSLPLVLKNLQFGVYPGEKVGICGRTGAGKSSIMTALYRLVELEKGNITIDGVDISQLGLRDLRSKLSIIPQDPVLFQGTIRKNLDPFKQSTDDELWDSLRRSGLISDDMLESVKMTKLENGNYDDLHKFHLDQCVDDDGLNFSLGEKQLIALARSLVRNSKILILDEATSSVDYETDAKIQETIVKEFKQSTILCIAHRLKTILSYDRILVMDRGQVVEKGTPMALYRQNGVFKQMCDKAHIVEADFGRAHLM